MRLFGVQILRGLRKPLLPIGMSLNREAGIRCRPPIYVVPDVMIVNVADPLGVMLRCPAGMVRVPPGVGPPDAMIVEIHPTTSDDIVGSSQDGIATTIRRGTRYNCH